MCPMLEELVIDACTDGEKFDIQCLISMAAMRALMSVKLKTVRIISRDKSLQASASELEMYVPHVECRASLESDGIDGNDEED